MEISKPNVKSQIKKSSCISQLDIFMDNNDLLHVDGSLNNSPLNSYLKDCVLFLKKPQVTDMIINRIYKRVTHGGRGYTINVLWNAGFWVKNVNSAGINVISKCFCLTSPKKSKKTGRFNQGKDKRRHIIYILCSRYVQFLS